MIKNIKKITLGIISLAKKGFFHVLFGEFFAKVLRFVASAAIARLISKVDYGIWTYSNNIFSIILLFDGLGIASGVLQFSSKYSNTLKYYKFGLRFGVIVNSLISIVVLLLGIFVPLKIPEARPFLICLSIIPIPRIVYSIKLQFIRAQKMADSYGIVISFYVIFYFLTVLMLIPIIKVWGILIAEYISVLGGLVVIRILRPARSIFAKNDSELLLYEEKASIVKFSLISSLANAISQLLYLIDTFLIGLIIPNPLILSAYKVATLIPYNLTFIPLAFVTFIYPYFAANSDNTEWIAKKTKKFISYMVILNLGISILLILLGNEIIPFIFGKNYSDSVELFKLLMIGYFFASSIRIPFGNIIATLGNVKVNLFNSILSGGANIILDIILIKKFGSFGAALATVIVFIISSVINLLAFFRILKQRSKTIRNAI